MCAVDDHSFVAASTFFVSWLFAGCSWVAAGQSFVRRVLGRVVWLCESGSSMLCIFAY